MKWPLSTSPFTFLDKIKIGIWLHAESVWTQGRWVKKYEEMWSRYTGCPYTVAVTNGSIANELVCLRRKWELQNEGVWKSSNKILVASNTWISNVSPAINIGFLPIFIDPELRNLNVSCESIEKALKGDRCIKTVFYTSLLGYACDLFALKAICDRYSVRLLLDNCESSMSQQESQIGGLVNYVHFNNIVTSSISCYWSHHTTSGTEMGMIFCQDEEEYEWYIINRCHGLTRGMSEKYGNDKTHPAFTFHYLGSNYRTSNLQAYMAILDLDRAIKFSKNRMELSDTFYSYLDASKYENPQYESMRDCGQYKSPLALPIISKNDPTLIHRVKKYLHDNEIESRPVIAGFLGFHRAFDVFSLDPKEYPRSVWLNDNGVYIGLHPGVTAKMAENLAKELNQL